MPSRRDEAIVLARAPLKERDALVVLLTLQQGVQRAIARRAAGGSHRLGAVLEPLNTCQVTIFHTGGRGLARVDEATLRRSAFGLAAHIGAWAAGQVVAELALQFCPEDQPGDAPFRLVDHCLEFLLGGGEPRTAVAYAQLWFLRLTGVLPDLRWCAQCGGGLGVGPWGWDAGERHLFCAAHGRGPGRASLPAAAAAWLTRASRLRLDQLDAPPPPAVDGWLDGLREGFTERPLRALSFFRQAVGGGPSSTVGPPPSPRPGAL